MKLIKKISVEPESVDVMYAQQIEAAIDNFSEFCENDNVKCEETCPFYPLCGETSSDIISKFVEYVENNVE